MKKSFELDKKFYKEIQDWYLWAVSEIGSEDDSKDLIQLLTRTLFVWFVKEKKLIPDELFDEDNIKDLLVSFDAIKTRNYIAILENIFLALSCEIGKRGCSQASCFNDSNYFIGLLDKTVPFLNEDLFDDIGTLSIPDYVFFGGNKKNKGLIDVLKSYDFTTIEISDEDAIDPEMIGKVFENLLACYNPETKANARKQTGSFYTPREIVNYMVNESLIQHIMTKIEDSVIVSSDDIRKLVTSDEMPILSQVQQNAIINAIDNCKVLDPACGSGAFPIGMLQKIVHILSKLDPDNIWVSNNLKEKSNSNEFNYFRKYYVMKNCIYGVDIQPIAIQISKLRFYLSLIIEQNVNMGKDNFGIRTLPNLEFRFVSANALIGIEKPDGGFFSSKSHEVINLENELIGLREKVFSASPREKRLLKIEDEKLRDKIKKLTNKF